MKITAEFVTSAAAAVGLGPVVEGTFFGGDVKLWLAGEGSATGGWLLILLPVSAVVAAVLLNRYVNPWLRRVSAACGLLLRRSRSITFHSSSIPSPVTAETGSTECSNTDSSSLVARIR